MPTDGHRRVGPIFGEPGRTPPDRTTECTSEGRSGWSAGRTRVRSSPGSARARSPPGRSGRGTRGTSPPRPRPRPVPRRRRLPGPPRADDAATDPQCQGDRVRGPRAHHQPAVEDQLGVEDVVPDGNDPDLLQTPTEGLDHVLQQVVRQRARRDDALLRERDRTCLRRTDPDREVTIAVPFSEQHDGTVRGHFYPDPNHIQLPHSVTVPRASGHGDRGRVEITKSRVPARIAPEWHAAARTTGRARG